jgi:AcrR family transcriptional regulator
MGYERATMSAIAERAHSSIGSLYQFFPNKSSIAEAIRAEHIDEIEQSWMALSRQAAAVSAGQLASQLVSLQIEIMRSHPALLALLDVPPTSRARSRRELILAHIATVLSAHKPRMSKTTALRVASVVQLVSRGLLTLYAQAGPDQKAEIIEEFKAVLRGYLVPKLK